MREIKFMALYQYMGSENTVWQIGVPDFKLDCPPGFLRKSPWCFFIGRSDEEGNYIYEGHIIDLDDSEVGGLPHEMKSGRYRVIWSDIEAGFFLENMEKTDAIMFDEVSKYTIVGHEFTHPELLNQPES